jgi:outer membrane protein assembly complex protein YaeT
VDERLGATLPVSRQPEITALVREQYADRGYRLPQIAPRLEPGDTPDTVTLVLNITAGVRTAIGDVSITGAPDSGLVARLGLIRGRPYDRPQIEERLADYEESLRADGHYEATVRQTASFSDDGAAASIAVDVQPGPRVRLVFAGDPLPSGERDRLVPVRAERSIDLDLLEDAGRNIEAYLREQGYRDARASYARSEGPELVLTFTVTRGPLHRVGAIRVVGNAALPSQDLEPLLKIAAGDPFIEARISAVASAVVELYRIRGFAAATLTSAVEVLPAESRGGVSFRPVDIRLTVVEGTRTLVGSVAMKGPSSIAEARLRSLLTLSPGRPFYRPLLAADRDSLAGLYRNEGYLSASVAFETSLRDAGQAMDVSWQVREGPRTLVDHILVSGNVHTSTALIRRELTLRPGAPLGADALMESQRRLSALGLFRRVRIVELPRSGSPNRDVLVEVEEAPSTSVTEGAGIEVGRRLRSSDTGPAEERIEVAPSGFFDVTRRNLWGKNRSISFFTRVALRPRDPAADNPDPTDTGGYGFNEYRVLATYREPRAFGTTGDAQLTGFIEQGVRASFNFNRKGVRAEYARLLRPTITATGRYTFDYTKRFDEQIAPEDQLLIDRLFPQVRLSTFFAGVLRDSRDDVLDPQRGAVVGLDGSVAARRLGSEVGFAKSFLQGFVYRRLPGRGYVVAGGARIGLAVGFARDVQRLDENGNPVVGEDGEPIVESIKDLPASERFFAGGDTTVRGFALDRLGTDETVDDDGFPQGGNGLLLLNAELRAPYWKGLGLVGFVDTGNVFKYAGDIDLAELRVATGFGVRYRSPIGPLRVDLGFKVHPVLLESGGREKGYVVHISLGQAF